jgi:FAD:protein FMN transferase
MELDDRRFSHEAMATVFEVHVAHPDERYAAQAAQAAFDLADRLERELSRFLPNSDISRVNRLAPGERTRVARIGDGVPGDRAPPVRPDRRRLRRLDRHGAAVARARSRELRDPRHRAGVRVDLGGIGKGYAVDRMAELLEEWGLERALVHGGFSSILALEPPAGLTGGR